MAKIKHRYVVGIPSLVSVAILVDVLSRNFRSTGVDPGVGVAVERMVVF